MPIIVNKQKVFNDPVHGFIPIPNELIFDIIENPFFQRLRRINQTGLTHLVYPGAKHSRFHHALGCMNLMKNAIETLRQKNIDISGEEENAVLIAILLHDIGHGPFSHSLENSIIENMPHEAVSLRLMEELNLQFNGELDLAISIFKGGYNRSFLTQLVSSQLDIDRLDYLKRDSYFTGVVEGNINPQRIISMLNVHDNQLVVDAKGIFSIEKFIVARMFMYWQVYLHKTSFSAELFLMEILKRAKELTLNGAELFATSSLKYFLKRKNDPEFSNDDLTNFTRLDDNDVMASIKEWQSHEDEILSYLCLSIVNRNLPKSVIQNNPLSNSELEILKEKTNQKTGLSQPGYIVKQTELSVLPYDPDKNPILILFKDKSVKEIIDTEQQILSKFLTEVTTKYHYCYVE